MNKSKNKNTPNPSIGSIESKRDVRSRDRDNAIENIKKSHPTKK